MITRPTYIVTIASCISIFCQAINLHAHNESGHRPHASYAVHTGNNDQKINKKEEHDEEEEPAYIKKHGIKIAGAAALAGILYYYHSRTKQEHKSWQTRFGPPVAPLNLNDFFSYAPYVAIHGILNDCRRDTEQSSSNYPYHVIKTIAANNYRLTDDNKRHVMDYILAHDLKELIIIDDSGYKRISIDDVNNSGASALITLCYNYAFCGTSVKEKDAIKKEFLFLLHYKPSSCITDRDGCSAASMLLKYNNLAQIQELKEYVDLECTLRPRTLALLNTCTNMPSVLCTLVLDYIDDESPPAALYYQIVSSPQSIATLKNSIDHQDAQGRTVSHLIAQNIAFDVPAAEVDPSIDAPVDTTVDGHVIEHFQKILSENKANFNISTSKAPLFPALFSIAKTKASNFWIQDTQKRYAVNYLNSKNTYEVKLARHIIMDAMIRHVAEQSVSVADHQPMLKTCLEYMDKLDACSSGNYKEILLKHRKSFTDMYSSVNQT